MLTYFSNDEILKLIRSLNVHKAHGHDDISIRMIKIYEKSLVKPLIILSQNSIKSSGISLILHLYTRKTISNKFKTIDPFLCYLFLEKYLKKLSSVGFITFFQMRDF